MFNFKTNSRNQLPLEFCAIAPGSATSLKHKHLSVLYELLPQNTTQGMLNASPTKNTGS